MGRKISGMLIVLFLVFMAEIGGAEDTKTIELGKQLFNDPAFAMSTNDKSCNTCHPGGQGISAGANGDYANMINRCIVGALKGQPLEEDSEKMQAMQAYIRSLFQQ